MRTLTLSKLLFFLVIFSSCKKSEPDGIKVYVPAYLKAMLPYTNGQSVAFSNGSGQTLNASVAIVSTFYNTGVCGSCASSSNPELLTYTVSVGANKFFVFKLNPEPYIYLSVYSPVDNYVNAGAFDFLGQNGISQPSCGAAGQACLTSITLNGITYTDVLEITVESTFVTNLRKAYYTVDKGLVGFVYANGTTNNLN
jgi:hypothetical protein